MRAVATIVVMMRWVLLPLVLVAGCGGVDANGTGVDAPTGPACTGVAYDSCTDTASSSDCMSGLTCRLFMSDGITVCTPVCNASSPCPDDKDGNPVSCNMMGRCKAQPNTCIP